MVVPRVLKPLLRPSRPVSYSSSISPTVNVSPVLCTGCRSVWKKLCVKKKGNVDINIDIPDIGFIEWHVGKFITRNMSWILCVVVIDNADINVQVHVRSQILKTCPDNNPAIIVLRDGVLARKTLASNNNSITWKNQYDIHSEDDIILTKGFDSTEKINAMLVAMNLKIDIGIDVEADGKKKNSNDENDNSVSNDVKMRVRKGESEWRNQIAAANAAQDSTPTEQGKEASVQGGQKQKNKNSFFLNMLG